MMYRLMTVALISLLMSTVAGCGDRRKKVVVYEEGPAPVHYDDDYYDDDYDDDDYEVVEIERRHVCSEFGCPHHYYDGQRVVTLRSHRHGPGCGHAWSGRYWIRAPRRVVRTQHVCTRACNHHYWNGSRLIRVDRHRHGPGCGHQWNGRYWIVAGARQPLPPPGGRRVIRRR